MQTPKESYDTIGYLDEATASCKKMSSLLNGLRDRYSHSVNKTPGHEILEKVNWPLFPSGDEAVDNTMRWICHYKRIMLRLDIIIDYLEICSENTAAALEKALEQDQFTTSSTKTNKKTDAA